VQMSTAAPSAPARPENHAPDDVAHMMYAQRDARIASARHRQEESERARGERGLRLPLTRRRRCGVAGGERKRSGRSIVRAAARRVTRPGPATARLQHLHGEVRRGQGKQGARPNKLLADADEQ